MYLNLITQFFIANQTDVLNTILKKTIIGGMIRKKLRKSRFTFTYYHNNWILVKAQGAHNLVE